MIRKEFTKQALNTYQLPKSNQDRSVLVRPRQPQHSAGYTESSSDWCSWRQTLPRLWQTFLYKDDPQTMGCRECRIFPFMRLGCLEPSAQPTLCLKLSQAVATWRSVTCRCQPTCLVYGKREGRQHVGMLGTGIQVGAPEIVLLTNSNADGMTGLNNSSKFGIRNNKIAKCLCRQSTFWICGSISLQARKGLVQWQVLGIRKPVLT